MKNFFKIGLLIIALLTIPVGVYLVTGAGPTEYRARAGKSGKVFVFVMPAQLEAKAGEEMDFTVRIDTGQETVGGVEILVDFNPAVLRLAGAVRPGSAFPGLTSEVNSGQIFLRGQGSLIGQGTIATLSFEGAARGEGAIEIDESSVVWDEGITTNIIGLTSGARVEIE